MWVGRPYLRPKAKLKALRVEERSQIALALKLGGWRLVEKFRNHQAAATLGIGQPHVSRAIVQLEADLGFPLFVRGHGSAFPTEEGEASHAKSSGHMLGSISFRAK
jgi:hypothetical protein